MPQDLADAAVGEHRWTSALCSHERFSAGPVVLRERLLNAQSLQWGCRGNEVGTFQVWEAILNWPGLACLPPGQGVKAAFPPKSVFPGQSFGRQGSSQREGDVEISLSRVPTH